MKANFPALVPALTLALLLAGCASAPKPEPAPPPPIVKPAPPPPKPAPPPPVPADWRDAPRTWGDWHWAREGALSVARYSHPASGTAFSMTCDTVQRAVTLRRTGSGDGMALLTITTPELRRLLNATVEAGPPASLAVRLAANDPLLDAMAFSRGRFMVEAPGAAPLYLPSWAEVSRVIEDCR